MDGRPQPPCTWAPSAERSGAADHRGAGIDCPVHRAGETVHDEEKLDWNSSLQHIQNQFKVLNNLNVKSET